jgi:hypothetical protein
MRIACPSKDIASQLIGVLRRHGISNGVRWEVLSDGDASHRILASVTVDPAEEAAIRRDVESIAGATEHN